MAFSFMRKNDRPKSSYVGHIALEIERFEVEKNSIVGTNIETGESMTVRMANKDEFERYYVKKSIEAPADRKAAADRGVASQPSVKAMTEKGTVGAVVQMQNVRELPNGAYIARWMQYVTTAADNQAAFRAMVEIQTKGRKEGPDYRDMKAILVDESFPMEDPAAAAKVENLLSNNGQGLLPTPFQTRTGAVVTMTMEGDEGLEEKEYGRVYTGFDAETSQPILGTEANITRPTNHSFEANAQAALAAKLGIPFESLQTAEEFREDQRAIYDRVEAGDIRVAVAPQISGRIMQILDRDLEKSAPSNDSMVGRGFFDAHVAMEKGGPIEGSNGIYDASFRQIRSREPFLPNKNDPKHTAVYVGLVAEEITAKADALRAAMPTPEKERRREADQSASFGASMG